MASRNPAHPMSTTERALWREAYLVALGSILRRHDGSLGPARVARDCAAHADKAVELMRERVTWRA